MHSAPVSLTPEAELEALSSREVRYRIGQFFTPEPIARYMAERLMETDPEHVLDPGVGGGVLLRALPNTVARYGLDIDPRAVDVSSASLGLGGGYVEIKHGDFLAPANLENDGMLPLSRQDFDAIIANPPYIKHHLLSKQVKTEMKQRYGGDLGARPSALSSIYVYFFLESIRRLQPGGRLVFITPTEFLDVSYGSVVKKALLDHCHIDEVLVFDGDHLTFGAEVLSTSAVTIATKRTGTEGRQRTLTVTAPLGTDLHTEVERHSIPTPDHELPWTSLTPGKSRFHAQLYDGRTRVLADYAKVRRGIATGRNAFFCLTDHARVELGIEDEYVVPCLEGARSVPHEGVIDDAWFEHLKMTGARCWLLWVHAPREALLGTNVLRYLDQGEADGIPEAYNCRARKPWYSVERVAAPDWFVTYMSRDKARFGRNLIGARCLTSLLNVWATGEVPVEWLDEQLRHPDMPQLLRSVGRTYGGGLGKTEPKELLRLPLPEYSDQSRYSSRSLKR